LGGELRSYAVISAKAGIQATRKVLSMRPWIPAFAGMTEEKIDARLSLSRKRVSQQ